MRDVRVIKPPAIILFSIDIVKIRTERLLKAKK